MLCPRWGVKNCQGAPGQRRGGYGGFGMIGMGGKGVF